MCLRQSQASCPAPHEKAAPRAQKQRKSEKTQTATAPIFRWPAIILSIEIPPHAPFALSDYLECSLPRASSCLHKRLTCNRKGCTTQPPDYRPIRTEERSVGKEW